MTPAGLLGWVRARDGGLLALRRAARAAIVMPGLFALGDKVIGNPAIGDVRRVRRRSPCCCSSTSAARSRDRLRAQVALALAGAVLVCSARSSRRSTGSAAVAMAAGRFAVLFAGVVSSVLASATVALLLSFILPVSLPGPISTIPDRLAGWGLAAGASLVAVDRCCGRRRRASRCAHRRCAPAARSRRACARDVAYLLGEGGVTGADRSTRRVARADAAVADARARVLRDALPPDRAHAPPRARSCGSWTSSTG